MKVPDPSAGHPSAGRGTTGGRHAVRHQVPVGDPSRPGLPPRRHGEYLGRHVGRSGRVRRGRYRWLAIVVVASAMLVSVTPGFTTRPDASVVANHRPRGPDQQQRGMVLPTWEPNGYGTPATGVALRQIAEVGAGWVQIVPTWSQASSTSSTISQTDGGPDDASVRTAVLLARQRGLKVLLKPHVDPLDNTDRSTIRPQDPAAWFASYTVFITHYAQLAAEMQVEQFAVGTELSGVSGDRDAWVRVIRAVRVRYAGPVVYAENHFAFHQVAFWDEVDVIGIDAYWPLSDVPTTDVAALRRSLAPIRDQLAELSTRTGNRILFTEAGYASQHGTVTEPWNSALSSQPAPAEQAAAYRAVLETFSGQDWWAGVFWWTWAMLPADPAEALGFSARGKDAEKVVREFWVR